MTRQFRLVQLSDSHIGAEWGYGDAEAGLHRVVAEVRRLPDPPDAVLVTGDLADRGAAWEYEIVSNALSGLGAPVHVVVGNHDDRAALRQHFELGGAAGDPVQHAVDLGPLRLVVLDTTIPSEDRGALGPERLRWLDGQLADARAASSSPTSSP